MASHSSTLAQKISWTEEPGGLQSMGLLSRTRLSDFTFTFHFHALEKEIATHSSVAAQRIPGTSLVSCCLQSRTESDTFEATQQQQQQHATKARSTAQRHTEPIDTPKPTRGHCTALQREKIQLHQPKHRHKPLQPGKHHKTLTNPIHRADSTTKSYNLENPF